MIIHDVVGVVTDMKGTIEVSQVSRWADLFAMGGKLPL